ncbi:Anaphase-promoting complex subunit 2, partial [Podochytrium sp. JEL0797]
MKQAPTQNHSQFTHSCAQLQTSGLALLVKDLLMETVQEVLEDCVRETSKGVLEQPMLERYLDWVNVRLVPWVKQVLNFADDSIRLQLEYHLYKVFCDMRINELFDIIVDFPNSEPALMELKVDSVCVCETDRYRFLKAAIINIVSRRLLHLGANTGDIISIYVSSIKCLNFLDPTGDLLESVSTLIRQYLRTRPDSMKSVITLLTDDTTTSLDLDTSTISNLFTDMNPHTTNHHATKTRILHTQLPADITSTLVQIFESPDVFVKEFQGLLADRLILKQGYDTDREVKNVEMLKRHFLEHKMHACEVMIKDVMDSKRVNTNIRNSLPEKERCINMKILSRLFWPQLTFEPQSQPACIQRFLQDYNAAYANLKSMRSLRHLMNYGTVDLDLELQDRTVSVTCTPAQAAVIGFFEERESWTLHHLSQACGKTASALEKNIAFWVSKGVVRHDVGSDTYRVIERMQEGEASVFE